MDSMENSSSPRSSLTTYAKQAFYKTRHTFKQTLNPFNRFPILTWLPKYQASYIQRDLIAGLTVSLTLIPQALAYAQQAGLPAYYGLYSSFAAPIVYTFIGGAKDVTNGPTAIMSNLVFSFAEAPANATGDLYDDGSSPVRATLLAFFVGIGLFLVAFLQLGFLANYVSHVVVVGFILASSITIPMGQIKKIFGLGGGIVRSEFFESIYDILTNLDKTNWADFCCGSVCLLALVGFKWLKDECNDWSKIGSQPLVEDMDTENLGERNLQCCDDSEEDTENDTETAQEYAFEDENVGENLESQQISTESNTRKYAMAVGWFIGSIRNAVIVALATVLAYFCELNTKFNLTITGEIPAGLPAPKIPAFTETYNTTSGETLTASFPDIMNAISVGILICSVMAYIESYAMARSFARKEGYRINAEQEMYAIGISCFVTSLFSGYPVTGSFSRSAINNQCNVATPLGGLVNSLIVILALEFMTEMFEYIPTAALASMIILAASSMFDFNLLKKSLLSGPFTDQVIFVITFGLCLYETSWGIVLGTVLSALFLILGSAWPKIKVSAEDEDFVFITVLESGLKYPAVGRIMEILNDHQGKSMLIDMKNVCSVDSSAAIAVCDLLMEHQDSKLLHVNAEIKPVLCKYGVPECRLADSE